MITYNVPTTGWYFIKVYGSGNTFSVSDPYLLKVSIVNAAPAPRLSVVDVGFGESGDVEGEVESYGCTSSSVVLPVWLVIVLVWIFLRRRRMHKRF